MKENQVHKTDNQFFSLYSLPFNCKFSNICKIELKIISKTTYLEVKLTESKVISKHLRHKENEYKNPSHRVVERLK